MFHVIRFLRDGVRQEKRLGNRLAVLLGGGGVLCRREIIMSPIAIISHPARAHLFPTAALRAV